MNGNPNLIDGGYVDLPNAGLLISVTGFGAERSTSSFKALLRLSRVSARS